MNNKKILGQEKISLLKPFPINGDEKYLLELADGRYVVTYWDCNRFVSDYDDDFIEGEIASIVSLKDLGL
jgi:hypothetical protein